MEKEIEEKSNGNEKEKVLVFFNYKNTSHGGYADTILLSFNTKKIISSRLHLTASGRHGTRSYLLYPAKYLMYSVYRSNLNNIQIKVSVVSIEKNGAIQQIQEYVLYSGKQPVTLLDELPQNIKEILYVNLGSLPLSYYLIPPVGE